ncbi:hypothetical protein [Microbacterium sp. WCS2018Hpa-9]|uniref:hypothetical protein n=1 Tax=Microbacterium sp. WCS2018Hpa-9 TaxID=3073635 RepID=UPI00288B6591|nr:hypothetical protein [Microbacterium sp. WCS2018Hpa-9]
MGFQVQVKSIGNEIWVMPDGRYDWKGKTFRSHRSSDLVAAIREVADERTLSFAALVRIVTDDGEPVSCWKIWPGRVKQLRRRY